MCSGGCIAWNMFEPRPLLPDTVIKTNRGDIMSRSKTLTRRTALTGIGAAALAGVSIRPARAADAVTLRLNWILSGAFSLFYNGRDKGFFRDEGIELTIGEGQGSGRTVQAVAAGSDMFGLADGGSIILGGSKGAGVRAVMGIM